MTLAEKILASHAGKSTVRPGELVMAKVDLVMGTDVTVPLGVDVFRKMGARQVFDPERIVLVNDHFVPAKDVDSAELSRAMRLFSQEQGIKHYYEVGRSGICHVLLPEEGLIKPGSLIVGADSHTCTYGALGAFATGVGSSDMACAWALGELWFRVPETIRVNIDGAVPSYVTPKDIILNVVGRIGEDGALYKAVEFGGEVISQMGMDGRFTLCNMAIEMGAKTGIIAPDSQTYQYLSQMGASFAGEDDLISDEGSWSDIISINASDLEPVVSAPFSPANVIPARHCRGVQVDQVVIGSCTNGRIEDFRQAASLLDGQKVHPRVRLIIVPATPRVMTALIKEGILEEFLQAGAVISPPTCGPCIGGHMGVLGKGEVGVYTTNRNFRGRAGHPDSRVYLAGPLVAIASAITGVITDPRDL